MKIYFNSNILRLVGKVGDVREKLKEWSRSSLTVQQLLQNKGH
jgi:hypothetical protein